MSDLHNLQLNIFWATSYKLQTWAVSLLALFILAFILIAPRGAKSHPPQPTCHRASTKAENQGDSFPSPR